MVKTIEGHNTILLATDTPCPARVHDQIDCCVGLFALVFGLPHNRHPVCEFSFWYCKASGYDLNVAVHLNGRSGL